MESSRLRKSSINVIASLLQNLINVFISLGSRIIFVKILNASYLGIIGLFTNVLSILSLADLGITTAMMYSLYKPIAENDTSKIRDLVYFFRKIYLIIAMVVFVLGIIIVPLLPYIIRLEEPISGLNGYYVLALLNVVISYLFVYRTILLTADQKNYILSIYTIVFRIITFVGQTIVLIIFKNYFLYLFTSLIITFFGNLVQNNVTLKRYPYLKGKANKVSTEIRKKIFDNVRDLFIYKICGTIQSNTDNILISVMVGTIYVGYYSNYILIISTITTLINTFFSSIKASVGNLVASDGDNDDTKLLIYWVLEFINYWIVAFCTICFVCLFSDCIELFFGKEYLLSFPIVIAIVLNFYTSNIRQTIWTYRETTGIFKETRFITAVTAIINIFLSLILGHYWGIFGIIIATVIARMIYAWWKEPKVLFENYFKQQSSLYFKKYISRCVITVIVCFVTWFVCNSINIKTLEIKFALKICVCAILPNVLMVVIFFGSKEFKYLYYRIFVPIIKKITERTLKR